MKTVLVIGYVWPEPASSAAGSRMMQILQLFLSRGDSITFATTASPSPFMANLEVQNIHTATIELNNPSFDEFLKQLQPDIVIFDRFMMEEQFGWRISETCPEAIKILDTEDLHCLRQYREQQFKFPKQNISIKDLDITKRELASIYRCDLSLIISEAEMVLLQEEFNMDPSLLLYLPFLLEDPTSEEIDNLPVFEDRKDFVSIGNFKHAPNVDAVVYLKEAIWPLIQEELPAAVMHIYGAYPTSRINQLHSVKNNFLIHGRAENAIEVVKQARVSLAAVRFGAGLKGKVVEAMQCGTPVVTTPTGAEGIFDSPAQDFNIAPNAAAFAKAAIKLYSVKQEWEASQLRGFEILSKKFSRSRFATVFFKRLEALQDLLPRHRQQNFIGNMLAHHTNRSTYFLSRYIELKTELEALKKSEEKTTQS